MNGATTQGFYDSDVVIEFDDHKDLLQYMPAYWREYFAQSDFEGPRANGVHGLPRTAISKFKSRLYQGGLAGYVSAFNSGYATRFRPDGVVFNPLYNIESIRHPDLSAVLATAVNDWMHDHLLTASGHSLFSIVVSPHYPDAAAAEIRRVAARGRAAQVILPACTAIPLGNRINRPIFEAAAEFGLPVALQATGYNGNPPTSSGWYTYFVEEFAGLKLTLESQLMSLITEGVLAEFEQLKVVLLDSGVTWLPSYAWRFDKEWRGMRRDVPWVTKPPSEYIREQVFCTVTGVDLPESVDEFRACFDELDLSKSLLFASRYPYCHSPDTVESLIPSFVDQVFGTAALVENTRQLYWKYHSRSVRGS